MPFAGRLGDKLSPRLMGFIGFSLLGIFFFEYRTLDVTTSNWGIIMPTLIRGVGISMLIAPITATAMNSVSKQQSGMSASMLNIIQQVGGSIGIAVLSLVLHRRTAYHLSMVGVNVSKSTPAFQEATSRVLERAHELGYTQMESLRVAATTLAGHIAKSASVLAFQDAFAVGALITFVAILGVFLLPAKPQAHATKEPVHLE